MLYVRVHCMICCECTPLTTLLMFRILLCRTGSSSVPLSSNSSALRLSRLGAPVCQIVAIRAALPPNSLTHSSSSHRHISTQVPATQHPFLHTADVNPDLSTLPVHPRRYPPLGRAPGHRPQQRQQTGWCFAGTLWMSGFCRCIESPPSLKLCAVRAGVRLTRPPTSNPPIMHHRVFKRPHKLPQKTRACVCTQQTMLLVTHLSQQQIGRRPPLR